MKQVVAIVRPSQIERVKEALEEIGVTGMTMTEVKGFGRQRGQPEIYRGAEYETAFLPKLKLEIVARDSLVQKLVGVLRDAAYTGKVGDGKVFVLPVEEAVRIRTGERGDVAVR